MKHQLNLILYRLKNPSVILSLVSQVVQILLLVGINVNQKAILSAVTTLCAIFVTLGVLSNPDTSNSGYGDDILPCSTTGQMEKHVMVAGQLLCHEHGSVYSPTTDPTAAQ